MSLNSLILFRDFLEDNRTSMEIYADNLEKSLNLVALNNFTVNSYTPSIPKWTLKFRLHHSARIRFARYFSYPNQAKKHQGTINHIVDQSYGHLLRSVDSSRTVITVHDLIPILAWKGLVPGLSYPHFPFLYKITVAALHKARAIIAVSQSTKSDLISYCGLKDNDITVIHNGLDARFRTLSDKKRISLRYSFGFPDQGTYVVLITGSQDYKNHLTSFRVIALLENIMKKPIQLVWLGSNNDLSDKYLQKVTLNNPVITLSSLSTERLVELYNSIDCLLFPSWYEGFGWPPLEAMACGAPVVASNAASLPEIVADAALTASPDDVGGLGEAVRIMLEDESLRSSYIKRGYNNISRFTWDHCATKVASLYQKILDTG